MENTNSPTLKRTLTLKYVVFSDWHSWLQKRFSQHMGLL